MEETLSVLVALLALAGPSVLLLAGFMLFARLARRPAPPVEPDAG
ncbi:hypothetical protein [Phenylobacterium sp.]|nr:hypothetical protein [Phenylobacterium sp.]